VMTLLATILNYSALKEIEQMTCGSSNDGDY